MALRFPEYQCYLQNFTGNMNYQSIYNRLIETRKSRILIKDVYYEKHHILPKSMGGENSIDNLVHLTAREHFLAHWLLWRIHKTPCMSHSFFYMFITKV